MIRIQPLQPNRAIALWLFFCCVMVAVMVLVGGLTRLTGSGLSMTDWHPIHEYPPVSEEAWQAELDQYRASPEYQKKNYGMELAEFKQIFWWEFGHRWAGRITGLVFALPLFFLAISRRLSGLEVLKFCGIFLLGGAQGFMGWYMVQSGLVDQPEVSHYRLTAHLGLAFLLFGLLWWQAMHYLHGRPVPVNPHRWSGMTCLLIYLQVLLGGLVAGLDAGLAYNSWPLMDGDLIPQGLHVLQPLWLNHVENPTAVQFQHRWFAFVVAGFALMAVMRAYRGFKPGGVKGAAFFLLILLSVQIVLGVQTLLYHVPVILASMHQILALAVFASALTLWHRQRAYG